jgi:hypothetical protein
MRVMELILLRLPYGEESASEDSEGRYPRNIRRQHSLDQAVD